MEIINSLIRNTIFVCVLLVSVIGNNSKAQSVPIKEITLNKYALDNLIQGIKSENCGVKRSAIYFAGKYRINEVKNILLTQLKNENEPCTRILIALVLYELGDSNGLLLVKDMNETDDNKMIRHKATHTYYKYLQNDE